MSMEPSLDSSLVQDYVQSDMAVQDSGMHQGKEKKLEMKTRYILTSFIFLHQI